MTITFCGHSNFKKSNEFEEKILTFLKEKVGDEKADIYLGGYGNFDNFAYDCCKKYKETHKEISLILITPYITIEYQKNHLNDAIKKYDAVIYPEIEDKPMRFAIVYRNRWMVEKSDFVIAYISHQWGGAYKTYEYALKKQKHIFNIADYKTHFPGNELEEDNTNFSN